MPKTIDNDIPVLDRRGFRRARDVLRSFGFNTACSEAERAIASAYAPRLTS